MYPLPSAAEAGFPERRIFALHLRHYNDALLIHDTVRAQDALDMLQDFYHRESTVTRTQFRNVKIWLLDLFIGEA